MAMDRQDRRRLPTDPCADSISQVKFTQQSFEEKLDQILTDFPVMDVSYCLLASSIFLWICRRPFLARAVLDWCSER